MEYAPQILAGIAFTAFFSYVFYNKNAPFKTFVDSTRARAATAWQNR